MWQKEAKCFQEVSPRCEGLQTHLNPTGLLLIAFDVHVNMTCFNIPAQNIPSSEDGATRRGLVVGGGLVGGGVYFALSAPSSKPPPPYVFQLFILDPPFSPLSCAAIILSACGRVYLDMVTCASWHIITRHFSKSMKPNRGASVSWIFSGWRLTMLLCLISAHADLVYNISLALSALNWKPTGLLGTAILPRVP